MQAHESLIRALFSAGDNTHVFSRLFAPALFFSGSPAPALLSFPAGMGKMQRCHFCIMFCDPD